MKKDKLPLLLMLIAGSTACIITFVCDYSTLHRLVILFGVLLLFYILGSILRWTLEHFEKQNEMKRNEEAEQEMEQEEEEREEEN